MASIVIRTTSTGARRVYVKFRVLDRDTGKKRDIWELIPTGLKKDATARAQDVEVLKRKSGGYWPPTEAKADAGRLTVQEFWDEWLERSRTRLTDRTHENYGRVGRLHILPTLGKIPLAELRRRDIIGLFADLAATGAAKNSQRNVLIPLRSMLNSAIDNELLVSNPADRIQLNGPVRAAIIPEPAEWERILEKLRPDAREVVLVIASLGLRLGEAFALRWSDILADESLIYIHATNHKGVVREGTKSTAGHRYVPLFPTVKLLLAERRLRLAPALKQPSAFVFSNQQGGPACPMRFRRAEWDPAIEAAGVRQFHIHDLRHFAATLLNDGGMDEKLRTTIIGHSSVDLTNALYTHVGRERISAAAAAFDPLTAASG